MFVEAPVTVNHIMTHAIQFRIGFVINLFSVEFFPTSSLGFVRAIETGE